MNLFAKLQRVLPVMPLAGANALFQPVWVEDIVSARSFIASSTRRRSDRPSSVPARRCIRCATWCASPGNGLVTRVWSLPLPDALGRMQAALMEMSARPAADVARQPRFDARAQRRDRHAARPARSRHRAGGARCGDAAAPRPWRLGPRAARPVAARRGSRLKFAATAAPCRSRIAVMRQPHRATRPHALACEAIHHRARLHAALHRQQELLVLVHAAVGADAPGRHRSSRRVKLRFDAFTPDSRFKREAAARHAGRSRAGAGRR